MHKNNSKTQVQKHYVQIKKSNNSGFIPFIVEHYLSNVNVWN